MLTNELSGYERYIRTNHNNGLDKAAYCEDANGGNGMSLTTSSNKIKNKKVIYYSCDLLSCVIHKISLMAVQNNLMQFHWTCYVSLRRSGPGVLGVPVGGDPATDIPALELPLLPHAFLPRFRQSGQYVSKLLRLSQWRIQDFLEGCASSIGGGVSLLFAKTLPKTARKWNKLDQNGTFVPSATLKSTTGCGK